MPQQTKNLQRLLDIMARLRGRNGCPWDRQQTHRSLRRYLVEECYEVIDAIESGDDEQLKEELGDLLLQVVFHAQLAREQRRFDFDAVAGVIADKLVARHPHVFGDKKLNTAEQVLAQWDVLKKAEKKNGRMGEWEKAKTAQSVTDGIPKHLPALMKAEEVQKKAAKVGFDWEKAEDVLAKIEEEVREVKKELRAAKSKRKTKLDEELGDLLFAVVNLARFRKLHAEQLLNDSVKKFTKRFRALEAELRRRGKRPEDCALSELDAIWDAVKAGRR
jgi:tetrapyrrole methylase family protein/MazG family protein